MMTHIVTTVHYSVIIIIITYSYTPHEFSYFLNELYLITQGINQFEFLQDLYRKNNIQKMLISVKSISV